MIVRLERYLSDDATRELKRALRYSNITWEDVLDITRGEGWAVWNCGGLSWVFTMVNAEDEIEVLLAGGKEARKCIGPWEAAMLAHPAHQGMTLRIDGRKGWSRLLRNWERRDDVLYLKVPEIGKEEVYHHANQSPDLLGAD